MPPLRTKHFYDNSSRILQPSTATLCQPLASSKFNSNTWPTNALPFLLFPGIISQQLQHFSTPNHFRRFPTPNHFPKISQTFCYHVASLNHNQSPVSQRPQGACGSTASTKPRPPGRSPRETDLQGLRSHGGGRCPGNGSWVNPLFPAEKLGIYRKSMFCLLVNQ